MRKISSFFLLGLLAAVGSTGAVAQETMFFQTNESGKVSLVEPSYPYGIHVLTAEPLEYTFDEDASMINFNADSEWAISGIRNLDNNVLLFDYVNGPVQECSAPKAAFMSMGGDGSSWCVELVAYKAAAKPKVTLKAPKDAYYLNVDYAEVHPDSDEYTFEYDYSDWGSFTVYANDGYRLMKITDQYGKEYSTYAGYAYLYYKDFPVDGEGKTEDVVLTLDIVDLSTVEMSSFTINFPDESVPYKVSLRTPEGSEYFSSEDKEGRAFKFIPGSSYTLSMDSYYGTIYKVEFNGEVVASAVSSYTFTPADGDVVSVYTEAPEIPVPVTITFAEGCDSGLVKSVYVSGVGTVEKSVWSVGKFDVVLGKNLQIDLNSNGYDNVGMTVNGEPVELMSNDSMYYFVVSNEEGYAIELSGTPKKPYTVTVITNEWESLILSNGYSGTADFELTGEETVLEIPASVTQIGVSAKPGYLVNNIVTTGGVSESYGYLYINGDGTVEIEVEDINASRTKVAAFYIDEDADWNYLAFSVGSYPRAVEYQLKPYSGDPTLQSGYNFLNYGDDDLPFGISSYTVGYTQGYVYLDNELLEGNYGSYPALSEYKEGQVIKIYASEQTPHSLTYDFGENVALQVLHDHISVIENPSAHNVLKGTQVHLVPVSALSDAEQSKLTVLVNNLEVAPDEDGRYSFVVKEPTAVVAKMSATGIENVAVSAAPEAVFNLQGIRVADSLENLPAGVYIVAGKKVSVK